MTATGVVVLLCVIILALAIGLVLRRRSGRVRPVGTTGRNRTPDAGAPSPDPAPQGTSAPRAPGPVPAEPLPADQVSTELSLLRSAGLRADGPCVVHFSAQWCGPCAAVRRVVATVVARLNAEGPAQEIPGGQSAPTPTVHELELDLDDNAELAQRLRVMSLPTTFLYDASGYAHGRISGVPSATELTDALRGLRYRS